MRSASLRAHAGAWPSARANGSECACWTQTAPPSAQICLPCSGGTYGGSGRSSGSETLPEISIRSLKRAKLTARDERRDWITYLHWFGYLSSSIVVLQLFFVAFVVAGEWRKKEERRASTRMQQGPASDRLLREYGGQDDVSLLNRLPPLSRLGSDGLRLVATPSFGDTDFALALRRTTNGAEGVLVAVPRNKAAGGIQSSRIKLPSSAYAQLTAKADALTTSWQGESGWWTDGTGIVFERVTRNGVRSGFGNSPNFYGEVGALTFNVVRPQVSFLTRFDSSWNPKDR